MFSGNERLGMHVLGKGKHGELQNHEPGGSQMWHSYPFRGLHEEAAAWSPVQRLGWATGDGKTMLHRGGYNERLLQLLNISFKEVTGMFRNSCAKGVSDINTLSCNLNHPL